MSSDPGSAVALAFKQVLKALRASHGHRHAAVAGVYAVPAPPPAVEPSGVAPTDMAGGGA